MTSQSSSPTASASLSASSTHATSPSSTTAQAVMPVEEKKALLGFLSPQIASYFVAGGCAGAASRTVVSPLERLKIIQCVLSLLFLLSDPYLVRCRRQVQPQGSGGQYRGVWPSLVRMWNEEGFKGFMRGNGINCLRIVPYRFVLFLCSIFCSLSPHIPHPALTVTQSRQVLSVPFPCRQLSNSPNFPPTPHSTLFDFF